MPLKYVLVNGKACNAAAPRRRLELALALATLIFVPARQTQAQSTQRPYWYVLEEGKRNFDAGEYGNALLDFEDARNIRRALYAGMEQAVIDVLSLGEVRLYKDNLSMVEKYINDRGQFRAKEALDELYYRAGKESLKNSVQNALAALKNLKEYPEADFWIGETYRVEGELAISEQQYRKALQNRALLQTPSLALTIEYRLAQILRERRRFQDMEACYADILQSDTLWQESEQFVRKAMIRTLKTEGVNRFLTMYRYKNPKTEAAHRELGFYYLSSGRHGKALDHLMFAVLIQNTTIIDEILRRQFDYTFTTLAALEPALERRKELQKYRQEVAYFHTLYALACALYADGDERAARDTWAYVAGAADGGEWSARSARQLREPHVEPIAEVR
jgi:tetratricopeptide (TPR) repeat protein